MHRRVIRDPLADSLFLLILPRVKNAHSLHIHRTNSPQKGFLQILLDQNLIILKLIYLKLSLTQLISQHLIFFLKLGHDISHFDFDLVLVSFTLFLFLIDLVETFPTTDRFDFCMPFVETVSVCHLLSHHLLFACVFTKEIKWFTEGLIHSYFPVELGNMR